MKRFKILFVLDSFGKGGAQGVVVNILRSIDIEKFIPELVVFDSRREHMNILPDNINVNDLNVKRARFTFISLARLIKKLKPDLLFSTLTRVDEVANVALELSGYSPKIILRSPNFLSQSLKAVPFYIRYMSRWSYGIADVIVASTHAMKRDLQDNFDINPKHIEIIHNPIDLKKIEYLIRKSVEDTWFKKRSREVEPLIISMGRLADQKGFLYLLRALKLVRKQLPAKLVILGEGKGLEKLQTEAEKLNINKAIKFLGYKQNPYNYIAKADIFVLSSLWEGFPNSLVEAMACGTPVVSTNCPSGPSEIITHKKNGLLVPIKAPEALANAIMNVLIDKELAAKLKCNGRKRVEDFEVKKIVKKYEKLFMNVLNNNYENK